ncbi:Isopentenyldiphosphate isomerase [Robiginitalea myxolifaciens]|uniref:Isopentenyldiphosphate isomerase n=1 Tax=Robiginitalea myxolifaciens TaxID=400055 RepID=A0A1I6FMZ0_9FLAO|nr:NUDIX domain-containing protein [Robiginitalea myxolifaciens]SFR31177.1 Isopentenyldiphosphate isomerase [Robiginitalea myxolifaciens]
MQAAEEWIPIWEPDMTPTGRTALKAEAHRNGWWHPTVHIWCFDAARNVLVQRRSASKKTFPGLWDVSVAGHVSAGEEIVDAALREIQEEVGYEAKAGDLKLLGIFPERNQHPGGIEDYEFHHCFTLEMPLPHPQLTPETGEVDALAWVQLLTLTQETLGLTAPGKYVPHDPEYYGAVFREIRQRTVL